MASFSPFTRIKPCRIQQSMCLVLLIGAGFCCLQFSWTSMASTRRIITSATRINENHPADNFVEEEVIHYSFSDNVNRLKETVNTMKSLAENSRAACNHSVIPSVQWTVAAQAGPIRWNVPLQHVLGKSEMLLLGEGDTNVMLRLCRRDCCIAGGQCFPETFTLPARMTNGTLIDSSRTCQSPSDISKSLTHGAWKRNAKGSEVWVNPVCSIPLTVKPPPNTKKRILFIGDSTMQELALMTAHAAGSSRNNFGNDNRYNLNCACTEATIVGTTKDCRLFDANGPSMNVSMLWSGHSQCDGNRMGVNVVDDEEWRTRVTEKVQTLQPDQIFFQVPISHSCLELDSCAESLERYICFLAQLLPSQSQATLVITGAAIGRRQSEGPTGRHCPTHLRKWVDKIQVTVKKLAPNVPILDIYNPTERWANLTSSFDPFRPACRNQQRHLTCDFTNTNFGMAVDSPFYILPPGRLAGAAIQHMISGNNDLPWIQTPEDSKCRTMSFASTE